MKEYTKLELAEKTLTILQDIPEQNWIEYIFTDGVSKCCAIGHINRYEYKEHDKDYSIKTCAMHHNDTSLSHAIRNSDIGSRIPEVNDNYFDAYSHLGSNPKDRVINYLKNYIERNKDYQ